MSNPANQPEEFLASQGAVGLQFVEEYPDRSACYNCPFCKMDTKLPPTIGGQRQPVKLSLGNHAPTCPGLVLTGQLPANQNQ